MWLAKVVIAGSAVAAGVSGMLKDTFFWNLVLLIAIVKSKTEKDSHMNGI